MTEKSLFARAADMPYVVHKSHGRHSTLLVTEQDMGGKGFILGCHTMDAGGQTAEHVHSNEQEAMFFFEGTGIASVDGQEFEIEAESVMLAPAGVKHGIRNTGTGPLKFAFVYSPPLPEHCSREEYFNHNQDKRI